MKTIAVHNIKHLKETGEIDVWEVIDSPVNNNPFWFSPDYKEDLRYDIMFEPIEVFRDDIFIEYSLSGDEYLVDNNYIFYKFKIAKNETIKAYQPSTNKLTNWLRQFFGTKVKVVGIRSKQIKKLSIQDGLDMGFNYKSGCTLTPCGFACDHLEVLYGKDCYTKNKHFLIYKLKIV